MTNFDSFDATITCEEFYGNGIPENADEILREDATATASVAMRDADVSDKFTVRNGKVELNAAYIAAQKGGMRYGNIDV